MKKKNTHTVDSYYEFISEKIDSTEKDLQGKSKQVEELIKNILQRKKDVKMEGKKDQMRLTQQLENQLGSKKNIYDVKEYEQTQKLGRLENKLGELNKMRCQLGNVKQTKKSKDDPFFNSLISREDQSILNMYKINKCDADKCSKYDQNELERNMIFVNGGCLKYNQENNELNVEHCMVSDCEQHFDVHRIEDRDDLEKHNIINRGEKVDKHFHIIRRPLKEEKKIEMGPAPSLGPSDSCNFDLSNTMISKGEDFLQDGETCNKFKPTALCLHKENGELSMRNCNHIKPHKYDYSQISGPCN